MGNTWQLAAAIAGAMLGVVLLIRAILGMVRRSGLETHRRSPYRPARPHMPLPAAPPPMPRGPAAPTPTERIEAPPALQASDDLLGALAGQPIVLPAEGPPTPPRQEYPDTALAHRVAELQQLLNKAEQTIRELRAMKAPAASGPPMQTAILRLSRQGLDTVEIARRLMMNVGEVELILNLCRGSQRSPTGQT